MFLFSLLVSFLGCLLLYSSSGNQRWLAAPIKLRSRTFPILLIALLLQVTSFVMLSMVVTNLVAVLVLVHWVMLWFVLFPYLSVLRASKSSS